jgi:drug/metabolite transporter (DMT)-like permease
MAWWIPAILTAFLWGVSYTAQEQIIKYIDKTSYIFFSSILFLICYGYFCLPYVKTDFNTLVEQPKALGWALLSSVTAMAGGYLALLAIQHSNASLAAALEISYPFWCMLIAYLLFGSIVTPQIVVGSAVVFLGVYLIATGK